jgi:hypothetical protein
VDNESKNNENEIIIKGLIMKNLPTIFIISKNRVILIVEKNENFGNKILLPILK